VPDVFAQPGGMAESVSSAVLERLPDRFQSVGFASVDGDVKVRALDRVEGIDEKERLVWSLGFGPDIRGDDRIIRWPDRHGTSGG
jgi:hypothetical protein